MHRHNSPVHGRHARWVAVVGAAVLVLLYINRDFFERVQVTAGSNVRSIQYVPMTEADTETLSTMDSARCRAALSLNPLEAFETVMPIPTDDAPDQVSMFYRLRNLGIMEGDGYIKDAVLLVVVYNNKESWGTGRTVQDFVQLVLSFDYPTTKVSLGILTSSLDEYDMLKQLFHAILTTARWAQVTLIYRNDLASVSSRGRRHSASVQKERRRMLARYRNYALSQSLESWHSHVVWIDADIAVIPSYLVSKMVAAKLDILQPLCHLTGTNFDYDLNAWHGNRKLPTQEELEAYRQGNFLFVPGPADDGLTRHMNDMRWHEFYPLDSVGGTMLYVKADIHRQGVVFTTHHVIGSDWKYEGYDGIETEGLCYVAGMLGYKCYAMPQDIIYHHPMSKKERAS
ncbi:hypothetical protein H310_05411 [Aphanomyces invadans]|uniref:Uncharacterized protein n=1 Tax=Aphanomyces invadans TaxID=157072 RepID=A0A024U9V1_9STRA|nr:hypothetical protein H310_05411 [Aphanomyces invadans]ETW02970.1 hypothetical protein H310_05411 [Aphanomyces invadans]|eukprot:XP_008868354.1 hypothetical protein H310_05411 [Aphanomyces invadans]